MQWPALKNHKCLPQHMLVELEAAFRLSGKISLSWQVWSHTANYNSEVNSQDILQMKIHWNGMDLIQHQCFVFFCFFYTGYQPSALSKLIWKKFWLRPQRTMGTTMTLMVILVLAILCTIENTSPWNNLHTKRQKPSTSYPFKLKSGWGGSVEIKGSDRVCISW